MLQTRSTSKKRRSLSGISRQAASLSKMALTLRAVSIFRSPRLERKRSREDRRLLLRSPPRLPLLAQPVLQADRPFARSAKKARMRTAKGWEALLSFRRGAGRRVWQVFVGSAKGAVPRDTVDHSRRAGSLRVFCERERPQVWLIMFPGCGAGLS